MGIGFVWDLGHIDKIDFDLVGFRAEVGVLSSCALLVVAVADSPACCASLTPSRISATDAPGAAVVTSVSVGRILPSVESSFNLEISSSVTRRSFSRRTSRPRL